MRAFGRFCAYMLCGSHVVIYGAMFVYGVQRLPIESPETEFGARAAWIGLGYGLLSLIGAITLLNDDWRK